MANDKYTTMKIQTIWIVMVIGFLVRLLAFQIDFSFENDVLTFQAWAIQLYNFGFRAFYVSESFTDYPPIYMYVLYLLGLMRSVFDWPMLSTTFTFFTFLPSMVADLAVGYVIYHMLQKKESRFAIFVSAAWVFNPSVILISSVWGQVESLFTLVLMLSLIFLRNKKLLFAYILFGVAILTKPQSLFLSPIYLYSAFSWLSDNKFSRKSILDIAGDIAAALAVMIIVAIPFGVRATFDLLVDGAGLRGFASVNAFNFWGFFGGNWQPWENPFLGVSYLTWGVLIIIAIIVGAIVYSHLDRVRFEGGRHLHLIAAALFVLIFVFSVRMHERYLFPGLAFLLIYFGETKNRRVLWLYMAFSITYFVNCFEVLRWLRGGADLQIFAVSLPIISFANIVLGILTAWVVVDSFRTKKPEPYVVESLASPPRMTRFDWGFICALTVVYSVVAFVNLGNMRSPQTTWESAPGQSHAVIDFYSEQWVSRMQYMMGSRHDRPFELEAYCFNEGWVSVYSTTGGDVFAWLDAPINISTRRIVLFADAYGLRLQEIAFRDANDEIIPIASISEGAEALVDEQHLVPLRRSFMNSTYFDEIYHPRTGYEYVHSLPVFETTHPPMGKNFIAMSVSLFGMTPFAWRLPGTLFGILMIPLIYAFARMLLKSNNYALFAAFIFTFDFMHFAQTRLATIDTYVTFFVIAMYFAMYMYVRGVKKNSLRQSLILLAVCGITMGLAIASKWQGIYGAAGLPILFFPALFTLYKKRPREAWITFASCFGFFVALPILIYILSYIPFVIAQGGGGIRTIWYNQVSMFSYHSGLYAHHPFSSDWWSWPLMVRPIWIYVSTISYGVRAGITSFGNPAVWWFGIFATCFAIYVLAQKRGREPDLVFLLVAYAAQFVPWVLVDRLTFIYHFFPSLPFVVLIIAWVFKNYVRRTRTVFIYAGLVLGLFMLFYPVLSGTPVSTDFVRAYLRWLPGWVFV